MTPYPNVKMILFMRRSRKFCQRGSNFDAFFLVDEGGGGVGGWGRIQIPL